MQDHTSLSPEQRPDPPKPPYFTILLHRTLKRCRLYTLVSLISSLTCCYLLLFTNRQCQNTRMYHFVLSTALFGMVNFMHYLALLRCLYTKREVLEERFGKRSMEEEVVGEEEENRLLWEVESISRAFGVVKQFKGWAYYVIFVCGNLVFLQEEVECDQNLRTVAFIMLSFGYIFSGFLIISLTLSVLMFILYSPIKVVLNGYRLVLNWLKERELSQKATKYAIKSDETHSCQICMNEVARNELVCVPCKKSKEHIFHFECIRKWMKVRSICPICRTPL